MKLSTKTNPLSYQSSKVVFEKFSLKTRERIERQIPSLRKLNDLIPYKLKSVELSKRSLIVEERSWQVTLDWERAEQMNARPDENQAVIEFQSGLQLSREVVDENPDKVLEKLVNMYLRNGTHIEKFNMEGFPEFWRNKNPEEFKLRIEELVICAPLGDIPHFSPFVENKMKKITVTFFSDFAMLQDPLIKSCEEVRLVFREHGEPPLNDHLLNLKQKSVKIEYRGIPTETIQELVEDWKNKTRPMGTAVFLSMIDNLQPVDVFDHCELNLGAVKSKMPSVGDSIFANCVAMPINEESELVVHWVPRDEESAGWVQSYLTLEVMPRGSTVPK